MAVQLLPLLLLGGGAVVIAKQRKRRSKSAADGACPAEVNASLGEYQSAAQVAQQKHGSSDSPFKEAESFLKSIMPKGCSASSYKTRIKTQMQMPGEGGKTIDFDLSATDLYMLMVGKGLGRRVDEGRYGQARAEEYWAKALEWYKRTTGKNFDAGAIGIELLEGVQGAFDGFTDKLEGMFGAGSTEPPALPQSGCPENYVFDVTPEIRKKTQDLYGVGMAKYGKDVFKIADGVFAGLVPTGCTKESSESVVKIVNHGGANIGNYMKGHMLLPTFYAHLVCNAIEMTLETGKISSPEEAREFVFEQMAKLEEWHQQMTGQPLPSQWDLVAFMKALEEGLI